VNERDSSRCPDPEVLAAFIAGNLSGAELEMTADHLRECEDCRKIVAAGARFDRENVAQPVVIMRPRTTSPRWLALAAAVLAGIAVLSVWIIRARAEGPTRMLIAATPHDGRYLEPRLSGGFPWAPLRTVTRGEQKLDPAQLKLAGVAGAVLEQTGADPSAPAQHASALASLLAGDPKDAVTRLEKVAASSPSAVIWSDLAAAHYEAAVRSDDPQQLAQALADADAALRLDTRFPEALFNRALILERLGLREQARAAWKRFLSVDGGSPWATEAGKHLQDLSKRVEFRDHLEHDYDRLAGDAKAAVSLVQRFPQDARVWGESEILSRWAHQETKGDHEGAGKHLRLARFFGAEIERSHGEGMLIASVNAIDGADPEHTKILSAAHIQFREAQRTLKAKRLAEAEQQFREAAAGFASAGSPMALLSRYFAAVALYEQGRLDEARLQLEPLLGVSRPEYVAFAAQVKWELGLVHASLGHWGQAMHALADSSAAFEQLGETRYAMSVREILAEVYDRIGEPREAWVHRLVALQEIGRSDDRALRVAVHAMARSAASNRDWPVSLSFLNLQTEMPRQDGDDLMYVNTLLTRARIEGRIGDASAAHADLARASAAMAGVRDVGLHGRAEAERLAVEASLAASPVGAIRLLTDAIGYQGTRGRRMFLPELLLQRGRAYIASGAPRDAANDFDAGIRELEAQRISIDPGDERWGMFGAADELFDEAVILALQRHDDDAAFAYCEQARGRELLDSMAPTGVKIAQSAPGDAVVLEYLVLPSKLVIFVVGTSGVHAVQEDVNQLVIADEVQRLTRTATSGTDADFTRAAAMMYDRLLAPVAEELATGRTLVIVPDDVLSVVPFAALIDPAGRYLIEKRAVVATPSLAAFTRLTSRRRSLGKDSRLLIVAGPSSRKGDTGRLTKSSQEAESVAAEYQHAAGVSPQDEDAAGLERKAATADVIHFVGHAIIPDGSTTAALVTSRREGLDSQLDAREIATLHLRRTSVVVLAACGTARSHGRTGEASVSIARAFLGAGVSSVVATLWPIDDGPAAEFFPRLHYYLARGLPPAEALRAAQLEWVHRRDTPPRVWAAVQAIGS
jgi:CHAT domain-containing protein